MAKFHDFTPSQLQDIKAQAQRFWERSSQDMQPFFNLVNDFERLWRAQLPQDIEDQYRKLPDRAALAPPDIYLNLKHLRAGLSNLIFGNTPYAQLSIAGQRNLRTDQIVKAEHLLQSMLDVCSNGRGITWEADLAFHQAMYAGITAAFTQWVVKTEPKVQRHPEQTDTANKGDVMFDQKGRPVTKAEVVMSYAETKSVDIRRVRLDLNAESVDGMRIIGYEYACPLTDLLLKNRDRNSYYEFDEKELSASSFDSTTFYQNVKSEARFVNKGQSTDFGDQVVAVRDIRGIFRLKNEDGSITYEDLIVNIANDKVLLCSHINPLPLRGWELWDFPVVEKEHGRIFSMGLVEPVFDLWIEMFIKRNQALDEATNRAYDSFIADKSAAADLPDSMERVPNQIFKVDMVAAGAQSVTDVFSQMQKFPTGHDSFVQAKDLGQLLQAGMMLNDYTASGNPSGQDTATGVDALVSGGKSTLLQMARNLRDSYLKPAFRKQLILWNFFNGNKQTTIYDRAGTKYLISPGDVDAFWEVDVDTSINADRPGMVRRFIEQLPLMLQDPMFDRRAVRETWLEVLAMPNANRLLPPDNKLKAIIARENVPLMYGYELPVIPEDEHEAHVIGHQELLQYMDSLPPERKQGMTKEAVMKHIDEHMAQIEQINASLGNTKAMGGAAGNLVQPEGAAMSMRPTGGRVG